MCARVRMQIVFQKAYTKTIDHQVSYNWYEVICNILSTFQNLTQGSVKRPTNQKQSKYAALYRSVRVNHRMVLVWVFTPQKRLSICFILGLCWHLLRGRSHRWGNPGLAAFRRKVIGIMFGWNTSLWKCNMIMEIIIARIRLNNNIIQSHLNINHSSTFINRMYNQNTSCEYIF